MGWKGAVYIYLWMSNNIRKIPGCLLIVLNLINSSFVLFLLAYLLVSTLSLISNKARRMPLFEIALSKLSSTTIMSVLLKKRLCLQQSHYISLCPLPELLNNTLNAQTNLVIWHKSKIIVSRFTATLSAFRLTFTKWSLLCQLHQPAEGIRLPDS